MAINWTDVQIEEIVASVMKGLTGEAPKAKPQYCGAGYNGKKYIGVYEDMNDAIDAAEAGYRAIRAMSLEEREKVIAIIRDLCRKEAPTMASLGVDETKMGRVDHKTAKHILVADKTPGTSDIVADVKTGDYGLTLTEMAPFGVVGSITPSTNPSETVICNSIGMIAAGNGVVFNPHPNAIATSNYAVDLINRASKAAGGPTVLVSSVVKPTLDTASIMYKDPRIRLLVCTGGPGVVKSVLSSGKKAIGAGAGNPPVIVDDTADVEKAGKDIIAGCTFDNNLPCIAEKECFVLDSVADKLIDSMRRNGAYLLKKDQIKKLEDTVLVEVPGKNPGDAPKKVINKDWVGRDARKILAAIGIDVG
ncbi:MAG: aldehyde dehydrogenase, partial [Clostridia bacterium]|nr:aldehyde dehydrogenase [Clostridia bacterium]